MNLKTVIALAIAAAFAAPVAAQMSPDADKTRPSAGSTTQPKDSNPAAPPATSGGSGSMERPAAGATATSGFGGLDKNNDGYISRDEAKDATWSNRFSELDKDNDGRLSQSEFDAMQGAAGATGAAPSTSPSTTGGIGDKPGQKQ